MQLPRVTKFKTLKFEPIRVETRIDKLLPMFAAARMDKAPPAAERPAETERLEPVRT
jgi:hypothetical protein